jgi:hypothetical protein
MHKLFVLVFVLDEFRILLKQITDELLIRRNI